MCVVKQMYMNSKAESDLEKSNAQSEALGPIYLPRNFSFYSCMKVVCEKFMSNLISKVNPINTKLF